jgi:hypothetical protein
VRYILSLFAFDGVSIDKFARRIVGKFCCNYSDLRSLQSGTSQRQKEMGFNQFHININSGQYSGMGNPHMRQSTVFDTDESLPDLQNVPESAPR